ncbi:hypothetical protein FOCC_FOCC002251 [Frankliniella occidentalis]|nr:hypothetical protein FOCC_FOCC002251 [Frankliniella occidentalis]
MQTLEHGYTYIEKVYDLVSEAITDPKAVYDPAAEDIDFQIDPEHSQILKSDLPIEQKMEVVAYWRNKDGHKKRKFSSVQCRYRKVKQESQLYRWEKQIEAGGTYRDKLLQISQFTYEQYQTSKREHKIVHDLNLRQWALQKGRELGCTNHFKASTWWLTQFKRTHKIVGRKITKFVSKKDIRDKTAIEDSALDFVIDTMPLLDEFGLDNVYNSDQSGFQYEIHCGRTLADKGQKKVEIIAQSKNALTHSYTIMPTMSASGVLIEPLYMVLQEKDGRFGPEVEKTMYRPPNVLIAASKSGKMGAFHLDQWMQNICVPTVGRKGVLVVDSWSTFTHDNIMKSVPEETELKIQQIPPSTTGMIQPWDVYGFRIYKNFVKQISDFILLHDIDIVLHQRDECIKLQSLVYNQLCSPRYTSLFKYSWFKVLLDWINAFETHNFVIKIEFCGILFQSGYVTERPERFLNPVAFSFRDDEIVCELCDDVRMLRCGWCRLNLCFNHFWKLNHLCNRFVA